MPLGLLRDEYVLCCAVLCSNRDTEHDVLMWAYNSSIQEVGAGLQVQAQPRFHSKRSRSGRQCRTSSGPQACPSGCLVTRSQVTDFIFEASSPSWPLTHYIAEDGLEVSGIMCTQHHCLFPSGFLPRLCSATPALSNTLINVSLLPFMFVTWPLQGKERS